MNQIPPVNLARQHQLIREETEAAVLEVLSSGRYIGGAVVSEFERQFASYVSVSECVACNSGTDALYLALRALNIGQGDEVITTSFSFFATAEVITRTGATPVFVDIDPQTFNIDVDRIESVITSKTKAIIPVHLFGQPTDMNAVMAIARSYNLFVIEDCAQATGARWQGKPVGSIGHIGCFSFFPTKNLGACGDGGAITTNDRAIAASIRTLKEHGMSDRYRHDAIGLNSRLDTIQAAILQVKLRYLDRWNQQRTEIAAIYDRLLSLLPGIELPQTLANSKHVWNQYTIRIKDKEEDSQPYRDIVRVKLQQMGIISMVYYPIPLHLQPVYKDLGYQTGQLPTVEQAAREVLSLPMFPDLSFEEQQQVVYSLKDCLN
ncbi:Cys/Met metabolism pyridoxal-phosphate-dependent enzyme [Hydrococcus rivularis NIES-593]|uniref:Cys/Met metabolism pyridoxal-phosphate-dependent enzyme n=1 Tax=Hydrococcus rivularis NIES-593 TaxID=1921803 RepID=A0A1U7HFJ9_9CYAN|nr:DegT/DnrJ/EryC1/StrS family aminotransferase [Hydrococcus rivularis]OKH22350.1 Cys/Met metabolism pyridoxal-phosphate-dependent enzyme [Hydrococcus rivularis NIES-593]